MKNLTHYFKSPKEDDQNSIPKTDTPVEVVQEKPLKRKISLSKSKKKKRNSPDDKLISLKNSHNILERQSKSEENTPDELPGNRNKKRKIEEDSNSSCKKVKTTKSSKIKLKQGNCKSKSLDDNPQTKQCESNVEPTKIIIPESENSFDIYLESSLSSDEPLVRTKRKPKTNLFGDSDDDVESSKKEPQPLAPTEKIENNENTRNVTSRNSLFSYFNKVDKETALKERKSEKIEVRAIVHSSPSGTKIGRKSLDKISFSGKTKKQKNKPQLDDSCSIEIISSEEIVDENSSTHVNVPLEEEQNHKSLSPNVQNKPTPSSLASIFIPKKLGQQTKTSSEEDISSKTSEKEIVPLEETHPSKCEKETKPIKPVKKLSKTKKSVKTNKDFHNKNPTHKKQSHKNETEGYLSFESVSQKEKVSLVDKNSISEISGSKHNLTSSKKSLKGKLSQTQTLEKSADKNNITTVASPKAVNTTKNLSNIFGKGSDKTNCSNIKDHNDEEKTSKKKGSTINGYLTPKINSSSTGTNFGSSEKCTKTVKSTWVMKVCLNSASKNHMVDSDEDDFKESQDSGKGESETLTLSQSKLDYTDNTELEGSETNPVVVIDDDDNSFVEAVECSDNGKRKSLPRYAKNPKSSILEEEDEEEVKGEKEEEVMKVKPQTPKPTVKIWPFFQKGGARQAKETPPVDEAKLKAKMLFLESGVPESIKRKVETVRSDTALGNPAPFPSVSHVLQADEETRHDSVNSTNLPLLQSRCASPPPAVPTWAPLLPLDSPEEAEIPVFERPGNVKAFLEKLKEEEPKTEVKVLYKKLKEYKSKAESDIWTEVYKPTNSADMVGNSENIKKLKTWLETLKNCRKREGSVSSGDEFVNEDSDGDDNSFNNMAVVCGPCGCGKTSAIYAIAKELDIKILEINASCNRSGKRILAEFSESTQSHHVERSQPINGFFNNQGSGTKKRKKLKTSDKLKSEKTSLILVEDADLLFTDCDEGFVPALASLAASSKRPIILVTNQESTPHLDRFNNSKLLRITFNRPRPNKLSLWLRLIGLVEGVMMSTDLGMRLVTARNCDVRRCLLELQLMVHSNNSEVKDAPSVSRLWWGWPSRHQLSYELPTLLEPEEEEPRPEVDKSQLQSVADTTRLLARLDVLSAGGLEKCLEEWEDPCPVAWTAAWRDSTALTAPSAPRRDPCPAAEWLLQALSDGHPARSGQTPQEARWLSILRQGEQLFMPGVATTAHTSHQSVTCDYLPMLRQLGRSEQVRLANYTRRANRFFNYLQGLGIHASKSYRDFMCDAFS